MGVSQALVRELGGAGPQGKEVGRRLLLGLPLRLALDPISRGEHAEASMLALLVLQSRNGSALLTAKKGATFSFLAEKWVKSRENQRLEGKVRRTRGLIASGVSGAVSGMIASIGPLLGSLSNLASAGPPVMVSLLLPAAAMAVISSAMLGLYTSGKGFYVNAAVAAAVFLLVTLAVAPLADLPTLGWGVK